MKKLCIPNSRFLAVIVLFSAILISSCEEDPTGSENGSLNLRLIILSGNNQSERAGAHLPDPLVVRVENRIGNPYQGIPVRFSTTAPAAVVTPTDAISDSDGIARCTFKLGFEAGNQYIKASIEEDSTIFTAEATEILCPEENTQVVCGWAGIYITTTGSSLLNGNGSVLIRYDPKEEEIEKILETDDIIADLSPSSREELYLTSSEKIMKVDPASFAISDFFSYTGEWDVELKPNYSGILVGTTVDGVFVVGCPPGGVFSLVIPGFQQNIRYENLAAHPVTRDLYIITGLNPPSYKLWRIPWGEQSGKASIVLHADITTGAQAEPKGMCIDSTGTVYITFDGNSNFRRIVKVSPDGDVDREFFDFHDYAGGDNIKAGRWGDITILSGELYLIDWRNDRLVIISDSGDWVKEIEDGAFSGPSTLGERYGITAIPARVCAEIPD